MKHDKFADYLRNVGVNRSYKRKNITTYHIAKSKSERMQKKFGELLSGADQWKHEEDFRFMIVTTKEEIIVTVSSLTRG